MSDFIQAINDEYERGENRRKAIQLLEDNKLNYASKYIKDNLARQDKLMYGLFPIIES